MIKTKDVENEFFELLNSASYTTEEKEKIKDSYFYSKKMHDGQKRASGEDYIIHPLAVAMNLIKWKAGCDMVLAGLLHDVVEDTDATSEDLSNRYGESVANLVKGVTKISELKSSSSKEELKAETIRNMLLAMIGDFQVIVVKFADKVHNMSTLNFLRPDKQKRIANETLEIYAPLAGKLSLFFIKSELEDLALKALHPEIYERIDSFTKKNEDDTTLLLEMIRKKILQKLGKTEIDFKLKARVKHYYSIYKKMKKYNKRVEDIFDLFGVRIITDNIENCYAVFGIVHSVWQPIQGRFKDYIANPKSNGYQSLHTTVALDKRKVLEIQIRTKEMDHNNEYGIAAHWYYKSGNNAIDDSKLKWLDNLKRVHKEELSYGDYYKTIRDEILEDEIYVFTPKGDIIELPKGSTPLDFAYMIHTEVGHRCRGAKADGKIIPLFSELYNGAVVDIITGKDPSPKREWVSGVKTTAAKRKIKHYFAHLNEDSKKEEHKKEKEREHKNELQVIQKKQKKKPVTQKSLSSDKIGVTVDGDDNILFKFANCCKPKPPHDIVGFISRGRGLIVHRSNCPSLQHIKDFDKRQIHVSWKDETIASNIYSFFIKTNHNGQAYMEIGNVISKHKGVIVDFHIDEATKTGDEVDGYFSLEVPTNKNIDVIMKELTKLPSIHFIHTR